MTGKQSSLLSSFTTLLLVISLVTISSSAPTQRQGSEQQSRGLHLDDIGAYFRILVEGIRTDLTRYEVRLHKSF